MHIYYLVDDDPEKIYDESNIDQMIEDCISEEYFKENYREQFDTYLDEPGRVDICGYKYWPDEILKRMDPEVYEQEFTSYVDSMLQEAPEWAMTSISVTKPGQSFWICDHQIFCYEDDDEDTVTTDDIEELRKFVKETKSETDIAFEKLFAL